MENFSLVMGLVTSVLLLLISLGGTIVSILKAIKTKKLAMTKGEVAEFLFSAVMDAEQLIAGGEEKKQVVMDKYAQFAKEKKIVLNIDAVAKGIDDIIAYSKELSKKKLS